MRFPLDHSITKQISSSSKKVILKPCYSFTGKKIAACIVISDFNQCCYFKNGEMRLLNKKTIRIVTQRVI